MTDSAEPNAFWWGVRSDLRLERNDLPGVFFDSVTKKRNPRTARGRGNGFPTQDEEAHALSDAYTSSELAREEDLDDEDYQTREVYAQFGVALYQASVLETSIWSVTTFGRTLGASSAAWTDTWDSNWTAVSRLTFGRAVKALKPHLGADDDLIEDLGAAVQVRNRLAHRFFWEHAGAFTTVAGREAMLAELIIAREQFMALQPRLDAAIRRYANTIGISDEELQRRRERHEQDLKRPWEG